MRQYMVVAFRDGEPDEQCVLRETGCIIGRAAEANLVLPHTTISRQHAAIRQIGEQVFVQDLASTNGVFVNGEQVKQSVVREGDFLTVGAYTVVIRAMGDAAKLDLPRGKTFCIGYDAARRLHEETLERQSPKQFTALYRASLLLGERLTRETLLREAVGLVAQSLPARNGAIVLCTGDLSKKEVAESFSLDSTSENLPPSRTLVDYVLRTRTAMLTDDAQRDPRFQNADTVIRRRIGSAMCVPLFGARQSVGVMYVDAGKARNAFTKSDLGFLTAMAHVVGLAVENQVLDERNAKQQQLVELGRAVAEISHDMRGIFTAVLGGVDILGFALNEEDPGRAARAFEMVRSGAERAERYMADLLLFVKEEEIERGPTLLNQLIQDVLDLNGPLAQRHGVELTFYGGGFERANIDGRKIHRAVSNVVKNAIEACADGHGEVTVSVARRGGALMVQVSDTGCGIAPEDLPKVSDPFFSRKGAAGTGLGLAISHRIVEQHGGSVAIESVVGEGTLITLTIPDLPSSLDATVPGAPPPTTAAFFKRCPGCGTTWVTQHDLLSDPGVQVSGYQMRPDDLSSGLFLFDHGCGTTLAVAAGDFRHLYDGPVYKKSLADSETCPRFCLHENELRPCKQECERAHIRETLQIVRNWPKRESPSSPV